MISNQILQSTIEGLKGITRIDFCIWCCLLSCESPLSGMYTNHAAVSYTHLKHVTRNQ